MNLTWAGALEESEMVMYGTISKLFEQTGYRPDQVGLSGCLPCMLCRHCKSSSLRSEIMYCICQSPAITSSNSDMDQKSCY